MTRQLKALAAGCALAMTGSGAVQAVVDTEALPDVEEGFEIGFFVKEPHIINPSALCFDKYGRLYVGAGPQYRHPRPDSPTDYIKILIDKDGDGKAETVKTFADGLNSVQAMAWRNDELWVANSPELTVLRDTDGDDVADEYQVVFTGLNNLRHGLHGLNWGPDGWLYMSMGNTWVKDHAPLPFRQLQGNKADDQTKYPLTKVYTRETYPKSYHPMNKRETEGGIFRCRLGGHDLELFARGMRNPWDICIDSGFNWLGTDNDPGGPGERIFMPVQHGHYTMRHPWVFDWMGKHIAVAPSSNLFPSVSGSGTGVVFYNSTHFPEKYRGRYLIADWTNNCIFLYNPMWDGSLQMPAETMRKVVDGGVTQGGDLGYKGAEGRSLFRPTDIEVGPDGALYMAGWGSVYGTEYVPAEKWTAEENAKYQGRVFRLRHKENALIDRKKWDTAKRKKTLAEWTFDELIEDIGHQLQVWRVNAQDELVRRGAAVRKPLIDAIDSGNLTEAQATWSVWALGHIDGRSGNSRTITDYALANREAELNVRIQATRILGENKAKDAIPALILLLDDKEPRVRLAAVQSLGQVGWSGNDDAILQALADETDRLALYSAWQVMRRQLPLEKRRALMGDDRAGIRLMAALGLMEERQATPEQIFALQDDGDLRISSVANDWLQKTGTRKANVVLAAAERNFRERTKVSMKASGDYDVLFTTDGSTPKAGGTASKYAGELTIDKDTVLRAAAFASGRQVSKVETLALHRITDSEWADRLFVRTLAAKGSDNRYDAIDDGLQRGVLAYADGSGETITELPESIAGATLVRTHPKDAGISGNEFLSFEINLPANLYVAYDAKAAPPVWLKGGFAKIEGAVVTSRGNRFDVYQRSASAGRVTLGGNHGGGEKPGAMYQVYLTKAGLKKATLAGSVKAMDKADPAHGREIFFGRGTCFACHKAAGQGITLGPDLNGIRTRRDVEYVIRSILIPDEYIVEGFQQTSLAMKDGRKLFGMIQEETAETVKIYLPTGEQVVVRAADILKRDDAKNSGMPSSFIYTLSDKDVADLTAWIMTLQ
jgi:putative membrane-bound dehydrogenase-like protein